MKAIDVLDQSGTKVEEVELNKDVFGVKSNDNVVYDAVQVYISNCLQGFFPPPLTSSLFLVLAVAWRQLEI